MKSLTTAYLTHYVYRIIITVFLFSVLAITRIFSQTTPIKIITLGKNEDGRLELFGYAGNYEYYHKWQTQPDGNWIPNWKNVNLNNVAVYNCGVTENPTQQIVTAHEANGALILFILNGGRVISYTQTQKNGNFGTTLGQRGGTDLRFIATGQNQDGRPELFAVAGNQRVYHTYEDAAGHWIDWEDFNAGGMLEVAAYQSADGSLNCVALGTNGSIYLARQNGPNAGWLTNNWQNLGGTALRHIAMNRNDDGRVEIFAIGGDNLVWHKWQTNTSPPFNWSEWGFLGGGAVNQIAPILVSDGREFIFATSGGKILFQGQTIRNQGWANNYNQFADAHAIQQIAVGSGLKNSWEVLALGGDGSVYRMNMPLTGPTAGVWASGWENFGQPAVNCPSSTPNLQISFTGAPLDPTDNDPTWIYIPVGGTATLSWKVDNCTGCKIGIRGMDGLSYSTLAFTASKLPTQGSLTVNPKETQTTYTLTATPGTGSGKTAKILVQLFNSPPACTEIYYYKITCGTYCKTQAICATSQSAADAVINSANPGCTIDNGISNQEFNDGCN